MQNNFYIVRWLKNGLVAKEDRFADLHDAKAHAVEQIQTYQAIGKATSAVVGDDDGVEHMRVY